MIKIEEVVNLLAEAELSNVMYTDLESKKLNPTKVLALVRSINLGLLELHKRFPLKTGTLTLNLQPNLRRYYLRPEYQVGKAPRPGVIQYIAQGTDRLEAGELLKVEKVLNPDGLELDLNISDSYIGVSCPQFDVLEINTFAQAHFTEHRYATLIVEYRKTAKQLMVFEDSLPEELLAQNVDLPYTHLQALVYFVAKRLRSPIGFSQNSAQEAVNYNTLYETECNNLNMLGLYSDQHGSTDRFTRGGWA